jgi:hypothetical protein
MKVSRIKFLLIMLSLLSLAPGVRAQDYNREVIITNINTPVLPAEYTNLSNALTNIGTNYTSANLGTTQDVWPTQQTILAIVSSTVFDATYQGTYGGDRIFTAIQGFFNARATQKAIDANYLSNLRWLLERAQGKAFFTAAQQAWVPTALNTVHSELFAGITLVTVQQQKPEIQLVAGQQTVVPITALETPSKTGTDALIRQDVPSLFRSTEPEATYQIWGVNSSGAAYYRSGVIKGSSPYGTGWKQISTTPALKRISVGYPNKVWAIDRSGYAYYRSGIDANNPYGTGWTRVSTPPTLTEISVGEYIWAIDSLDKIYYRSGKNWVKIPGELKKISAKSGVNVWGVCKYGRIYKKTLNNEWQRVYEPPVTAGITTNITVSDNNEVWLGSAWGKIYYYSGGWKECTPTGARFTKISAGPRGQVWCVNANGQIYYRTGITTTNIWGTGWQNVPGLLIDISVSSIK